MPSAEYIAIVNRSALEDDILIAPHSGWNGSSGRGILVSWHSITFVSIGSLMLCAMSANLLASLDGCRALEHVLSLHDYSGCRWTIFFLDVKKDTL